MFFETIEIRRNSLEYECIFYCYIGRIILRCFKLKRGVWWKQCVSTFFVKNSWKVQPNEELFKNVFSGYLRIDLSFIAFQFAILNQGDCYINGDC